MKRCFTLVEVVVAVGILMAVMGVAAFAFASVQSSWRTASEVDVRLKQCQMLDRVLDNAIRNAVPFYWKDRNNKELLLFYGGEKSVYLSYLHRVGERELGGIRFLRLYLDNGSLIAEYRPTPIVEEADFASGNIQREVIAESIKHIQLEYANLKDNELEWFSEWDTEDMKDIPMAILLTVTFADDTKETWFKRTAGNSRNMQYGNRQGGRR